MTATITRVPTIIAGAAEDPGDARIDPIPDPATGELIAHLPYSSAGQIERAVAAAAAALPAWADTPVPERAQVMFRFKALLEDQSEALAALITQENGKTIADARGEVRRAIEVVDFACGAPTLLMGTGLDQIARGIDEELVRFPVGVVAGITPFNFPLMVPLWMIPIALACGNTFVLKPSQRTPLSAIRVAELLVEAGLPSGAFSVVHGDKAAVDALIEHPAVAAVSFVGSAAVAAEIYRSAANQGKRVQALGGAKNHLIVMDDADLDASVAAIIASAFGAAGQRCLAGSVVVAVGAIGDRLVESLSAAASSLRIGPGSEPACDLGPVIRDERRRELAAAIDEAIADGAVLVRDGRGEGPERGYFLGPTLFDQVRPEMRVWRDELFGPVLAVVRARDLDDALATVNSSHYGNAASIFTASGKHAREFRRRVEAGMLGVNIGVAAPMVFFPFAGWKGSFYGDLHATGQDAVAFYTRKKVVTSRWF
jgi:malonate-semialdehyde dehydrogenase (acetylating) / methylmalonate-semialdehyde dehydrogenase